MRSLHQFFLFVIWCICLTVIQRTEPFLFRRNKAFHQLVDDPYQVKPVTITAGNMFKWMNLQHHIKFKLWTRKNPKWAQEIIINDVESILTSNFDTRRLTKIIVHGWAHSANEVSMEDWILALRDAYLRLADLNIIIIDYTMFALPIMYFSAAPDMAARRLSEFIDFLVKNGAEFNHFHMLGYSWGAHVAGIAGHLLQGKVGRITGLDPANPTFRLVDNTLRLDKDDAEYVDIIHTGGGPFLGGHLGLELPLGHADFYPNGGIAQPGCAFHWGKLDEGIECDHGRSVWYFVESINSPFAFSGCPCDSWGSFVRGSCPCHPDNSTLMGEHTSHLSRGVFYLFTRGESPFGIGPHMNLTLQSMDEYDPEWSKYDHTNHNFTSSSAQTYLSNIVQKSILKLPTLPLAILPRSDADTETGQLFRSHLLRSVKRNPEKFKNAVLRPIRQTQEYLSKSQLDSNS